MKKAVVLLVGMFLFCGCSYSQNMINREGQTVRCASWGWGFIGGPMAINTFNDCISSHKQMGFVEVEKVGVPGFFMREGNPPSILTVQDGYPAKKVGMMAGDIILEVNETKVTSMKDVILLSFGQPGEMVSYQIKRGEEIKTFVLVRVPKASKEE